MWTAERLIYFHILFLPTYIFSALEKKKFILHLDSHFEKCFVHQVLL